MLADERDSAMATARKLNQEGIPMWHKYHSKGNSEASYRSKPGAKWWPSNITRIIRSGTYKGVHVWDAKDKKISRKVPPLVNSDTWERANRQLSSNKLYPKRGTNNRYLLRGLI